jgi:alkylation response protein AidB-like acyl-CoA dehydrogenase
MVSGEFPYVPYASAATHLLVPLSRNEDGLEFGIVDAAAEEVLARPLAGFLARNDEVILTNAALIGTFRATTDEVEAALALAYVTIAAYSVGGCQVLLERSIDYSQTRQQFSVPIGKFQRVQDHIVELVNALDAARWMMYEALWKIDSDLEGALAAAHRAKAVAADSYVICADAAHKVHGGIGVDPDFGVTLYTQQSRSLYDLLGAPRWHKRKMVSELDWAAA